MLLSWHQPVRPVSSSPFPVSKPFSTPEYLSNVLLPASGPAVPSTVVQMHYSKTICHDATMCTMLSLYYAMTQQWHYLFYNNHLHYVTKIFLLTSFNITDKNPQYFNCLPAATQACTKHLRQF